DLSHAPNAAPGNPPLGNDPRGYFSSARKGGGVEQDRTRTQTIPEISSWRTRPNFLANFLGKNFGNKNRWTAVLAPLVTIFLAPHVAPPPAPAPTPAQDIFCTQVGPPCSLACQPSISCSWRRSSL